MQVWKGVAMPKEVPLPNFLHMMMVTATHGRHVQLLLSTVNAPASWSVRQVNQLEDELEDAKSGSAAAAVAPPQQQPDGADMAALRDENAAMQRRLTALQLQVKDHVC